MFDFVISYVGFHIHLCNIFVVHFIMMVFAHHSNSTAVVIKNKYCSRQNFSFEISRLHN